MQGALLLIWLAIGICQFAAGIEGMHLYFGTGTFVSFLLFGFSYLIPLIGTIVTAAAVYYGAKYGFRWETWQAILLAVPGILLMAIVLATGGLAALFSRRA